MMMSWNRKCIPMLEETIWPISESLKTLDLGSLNRSLLDCADISAETKKQYDSALRLFEKEYCMKITIMSLDLRYTNQLIQGGQSSAY